MFASNVLVQLAVSVTVLLGMTRSPSLQETHGCFEELGGKTGRAAANEQSRSRSEQQTTGYDTV